MTPTRSRPLTIVADDLTGACDAGALFAGRAPVPVTVWPRRAVADAAVRVVDTETRAPDAPRKRPSALAAVGSHGRAGRRFKKIDSTLRGPIGAEVDALMRATGAATAIVCPAFPAQGRVVLDRLLLVDGVPVAETPDRRVTRCSPVVTSSVVETAAAAVRPRAGLDPDRSAARRRGRADRADRTSGRHGRSSPTRRPMRTSTPSSRPRSTVVPPPLLAGSAGLARALAARLGLLAERAELPSGRRWLRRGRQPCSRPRAGRSSDARAAGLTVLATPERRVADPADAIVRLAAQAAAAIERGALGSASR